MRRLAVVGTKHFEAAATRLPERLGALAEHVAIFRVKIDRGGVPSVLAEARHPVAVSRADLDHFSISEMPEQRRVDGLGRADGRGVGGRWTSVLQFMGEDAYIILLCTLHVSG